jgi:hypothetical protein
VLRLLGRDDDITAACAAIREPAARIGWLGGPAVADKLEAELAPAAR